MAFSYVLSTDIGKVRLEIGDTVSGVGVRPDGSNLTDAEVEYFLTQEGSVGRAVARACEVLATMWAGLADLTVGPRHEALGAVAQRYAERAQRLRVQHGGTEVGALAVGMIRQDGYQSATDPEASDEIDESGGDPRGEYMGTTIYIRAA
jgi:hypothetical protein